jgi:hypothetical protein
VRKLALLLVGAFAGFVAAAQVVKRAVPSRGDADSDELGLVALFDGVDLESRATAFRGGSVLAWFGGSDVDLRDATLAGEATLTVTALFGGVSLRIPPEWRVENAVRVLAGGVGVSGPDPEDPDAPLLRLEGLAAFGGVGVSRKPAPEPEPGV